MEVWAAPVNYFLKDDITKLDHTLVPAGFGGDIQSLRNVQETLSAIIDTLGHLSAMAQGLTKVITTGRKMRSSPSYFIYLLKDPTANHHKGEVIGLLKVGHKHLYLGDRAGKTIEVDPLCILDFYVNQDRQRCGLGKMLFDYMLQDMNLRPHHLAVDGPSPIMNQFLAKFYGLHDMIINANNFAVASDFFEHVDKTCKSNCSTPASTSTSSGAGRFTAQRPESGISQIIHGDNSKSVEKSRVSPAREERPRPAEAARAPPSPVETEAGDESPPGEARAPLRRPCSLRVETAPAAAPEPAPSPAGSTVSRCDSQLTEKGFFDVKFYHNKLW